MTKYIDANKLEKALLKKNFYPAIVRNEINKAEAEDVELVRHGHWIPYSKTVWVDNDDIIFCEKPVEVTEYKCSVCGATERTNKYPYCHCGAKMDEAKK